MKKFIFLTSFLLCFSLNAYSTDDIYDDPHLRMMGESKNFSADEYIKDLHGGSSNLYFAKGDTVVLQKHLFTVCDTKIRHSDESIIYLLTGKGLDVNRCRCFYFITKKELNLITSDEIINETRIVKYIGESTYHIKAYPILTEVFTDIDN